MTRLSTLLCGVILSASTARAEAPSATWRDALAALAVPPACATLLVEALTVSATPPPGVVLSRTPTWSDTDPSARLAATGGIPFMDYHGRIVRAAATRDEAMWLPRHEERVQINRGYARLDLGARAMLVIDHMPSPIESATSLWEDTGRRVVRRAFFPGEIVTVEDQPERVLLHLNDPLTASAVSWDKASERFVGECMIGTEATGAIEDSAQRIFASTPRAFRVVRGRTQPLRHAPPAEHPDAAAEAPPMAIGKLAPGTRGVILYTRADGWALTLAPAKNASAIAALFRTLPSRLWQTGWLPPAALASP